MAPADLKPSEVLYSIQEFLLDCELKKSAKALKKEAELSDESTTILRVPLFEAVKAWQSQQAAKEETVKNGSSEEKKKKKKKRKREEKEEEEEEEEPKCKINEAAKAAEEWMAKQASSPSPAKSAKKREPGKPFSRVDDSKWLDNIHDEKLKDNTYEGTYGSSGYGHKASQKLVQVRGKQFRHEKTKKKRGSYRGGTIDLGSNSIKF